MKIIELFLPKIAFAQKLDTYYEPAKAINTAVGGSANLSLANLISPLVQNFTILVGVAALFTLIFSGYRYIQSGADVKSAQQAQNMITYSIIGLALSALAFWITRLLFTVFAGGIF